MNNAHDALALVQHGTPAFPVKLFRVGKEDIELCTQKYLNGVPMIQYHALPLHCHDDYEIIYIKQGSLSFDIEGQIYDVKPGDILNINSYELHSATTHTSESLYYSIVFNIRFLESKYNDSCQHKYIDPLQRSTSFFVNRIPESNQGKVAERCLLDIIQDMQTEYNGYELNVRACLYHYIALCYANGYIRGIGKNQKLNTRKNYFIQEANRFIEAGYTKNITIDDAASALNYSKFAFCRVFKKAFGTSFMDYVNRYRINIAWQLLKDDRLSITDVAYLVGYNSSAYFSRVFRSYIGISPSQVSKIKI